MNTQVHVGRTTRSFDLLLTIEPLVRRVIFVALSVFFLQAQNALAQTNYTLSPAGVVNNYVATLTPLMDSVSATRLDNATGRKICNSKGYQTLVSITPHYATGTARCHYSPHDNFIVYWDPGISAWRKVGSEHTGINSQCIKSVTCSNPPSQCQDGVDNDGDGFTDCADPGCWSNRNDPNSCDPNKNDESWADPECNGPQAVDTQSCNSGLPGICAQGYRTRTCLASLKWSAFGACVPWNTPGTYPEQCSGGQDEDCDGAVDSQDSDCWVCSPGQTRSQACSTGYAGVCSSGTKISTCSANGQWSAYGSCVANVSPGSRSEHCSNGTDDDCDGAVDGQDSDCFVCAPGQQQSKACSSGYPGVCSPGTKTRTCSANGQWGSYGACSPSIWPGSRTENCSNGVDDDCDGANDSNDNDCYSCNPNQHETADCMTGLSGICAGGTRSRTCSVTGQWGSYGTCHPTIAPSSVLENCSNGLDDDCDGAIDSLDSDCFACSPNSVDQSACASGLPGACSGGTMSRTCLSSGTWGSFGSCIPNVSPGSIAEQCADAVDNDCDGATDLSDSDCDPCPLGNCPVGPECFSQDNTALQFELDIAAGRQRDYVKNLARRLRSATKSRKTRAFVKNSVTNAKKLYKTAWTDLWSVPARTSSCTGNVAVCATADYSTNVTAYNAVLEELNLLVQQVYGELKSRRRAGKRVQNILNKSNTELSTTLITSSILPTSNTSCQ